MGDIRPVSVLTDRQHATALHVHGVMAQYIMFWRRMIVDVSVFAVTAMLAITGFVVSRDEVETSQSLVYGSLLITLGLVSSIICGFMAKHMRRLAGILVKLDHVNQVFEPSVYLQDDSLYPASMMTYGTPKWKEPLNTFCIAVLLVLPVVLGFATG